MRYVISFPGENNTRAYLTSNGGMCLRITDAQMHPTRASANHRVKMLKETADWKLLKEPKPPIELCQIG